MINKDMSTPRPMEINEYENNKKTIARLELAGSKALEEVIHLRDCQDELVEALKEIIKNHEDIGIPGITLSENCVVKAKQALKKVES